MTTPTPTTTPGRRLRGLLLAALTVLVGLLLPAASASTTTTFAPETRVELSQPLSPNIVGVHECITAGQRPVRGPSQLQVVVGNCVAAEGALPELSASRAALEAKFKHAGDFGVSEGRGAAAFDAYGKAIDSFVGDSATTRIVGTYRGGPAILNYNANTAQVVVQGTDGTFISGWQMSPAQLQNVIERGSLGGG